MGFSRQEYWSGLPFPFLEELPGPAIEPGYPALQADSLPFRLRLPPKLEKMAGSGGLWGSGVQPFHLISFTFTLSYE